MIKLKIIISLLIVGSILYLSGADKEEKSWMNGYLTKLRSEDIKERETAARAIVQDRQNTIGDLHKLLKEFIGNEERKGTAKTIIVLLGDIKSVESIPLLVENLTLRVFYKENKRFQSIEDQFPCVDALTKIGVASLNSLLEKVSGTDDENVRICTATVFKNVLGKKMSIFYIKDYMENVSNHDSQQKLSRLLQSINEAKDN